MKAQRKIILSLLAGTLTGSIIGLNVSDASTPVEALAAGEGEKWSVANNQPAASSTNVSLSSEHLLEGGIKTIKAEIAKSANSFGGVKLSIGEKFKEAKAQHPSLVSLNVKFHAPNTDSVLGLYYVDDGVEREFESSVIIDGLPSLVEGGDKEVKIDLATINDIDDLIIGVHGSQSVTIYIQEVSVSYGDSASVVEQVNVPTATSIASIALGQFQYGGIEGTTISGQDVVDAQYSKETDGSAKHVSIVGTGPTDSRIYSVYFPLKAQAAALELTNPIALSFWVNNRVAGTGGLLFKVGSEITSGIKLFDENNEELTDSENNRNLDYVGFRRYQITLTAEQINNTNEIEIGVWGASLETNYYLSAFSFIDQRSSIQPTTGKETFIDGTSLSLVTSYASSSSGEIVSGDVIEFNADFQTTDQAVDFVRDMDDIMTPTSSVISLTMSSDAPYSLNVMDLKVGYDNGDGIIAYHSVSKASFADTNPKELEIDIGSLPYFINAASIETIAVSILPSYENVGLNLSAIAVSGEGYVEKKLTYTEISSFDTQADVAKWSASYASGVNVTTGLETENVKKGEGSFHYKFENVIYDFAWTEVYIDVGELIENNADKDLYGISFYLYNTSYIEPGQLGFWVKVAEKDSAEFEVKYDHVYSELDTNNSLGFTGWQKINIPFGPEAWTEQTYYSGYDPNNPRSFNANNLQFIKIGFWGTYYDASLGYSCDTYLDQLSLLSDEETSIAPKSSSIAYELNGGKFEGEYPDTYVEGTGVALANPTRDGYTFKGWYLDNSLLGEPITEIDETMTGDVTLYAAWEKGVAPASDNNLLIIVLSTTIGGGLLVALGIGLTVFLITKKKGKK